MTSISRRDFLVGAGAAVVAGAGCLLTGSASASPRISAVRDPALSPATLTMWCNHPEWAQQVSAFVAEFQKQNPSVTIQVTQKPGGSYQTDVTAAIAAGSAPDIIGVSGAGTYLEYVKGGHYHDLTGKIDEAALTPAATSYMTVGKKIYALPLFGEYTVGMFYWKSIFQKYGLALPTTWPELTAICKTLSKNGESPLEMGTADGGISTWTWTGLLTSVRGTSTPGLVAAGQAKLTDPDLLAATEYLYSLQPYFAPGYASTTYVEGKNDFAEGKAMMIMGGSADYTGYTDTNPGVVGKVGYFAFPHPQGSGAATVMSGVDNLYGLNSSVTDPAQIAAAIKFFNFFLTPKIGTQVAETIELPDTKGAHTTVPMQERIIEQSYNDAPVWFQYEQLSNMWNYATNNISDMLLGSVSPKAFAAACQSKVVVSNQSYK
jgi:ABC-type glycerol-3-phosphate transport system substrate-binding protein